MSLEVATHKAVHDALAPSSSPLSATEQALVALIGRRVYDKVPNPKPPFPYVVIDVDITGDGNTCSDASAAHVTVHIWTTDPETGRVTGSIQAKSIGGLIREILAPLNPDDAPSIEGYLKSAADIDAAIYRDGGETLLTEGVLTFTYLVDPES